MKLNLQILADELNNIECFVFDSNSSDDSALVFDRWERYTGQEIDPSCVYLIEAEKLSAELILKENGSWICFGNIKNSILQYRRCSLMMIPSGHYYDGFGVRLGKIFTKYNRWSESLLTLAVQNDGIRQIFKSGLLEEIFQNPILMQDGNGLFGIACGELPPDFDSERWLAIVERRPNANVMDISDFDELMLQGTIKTPFIIETTEHYSFLATNAFNQGEISGRLTHCNSRKPFTKGYISLAMFFNTLFEGIVERNVADGIVGVGDSNVFIELLGAWHTDSNWLNMQLDNIGWKRDCPSRLVVVALDVDEKNRYAFRMIKESMTSKFPGDYIFEYKGALAAVLTGRSVGIDDASIRLALDSLFSKTKAIVAVSEPFYDVSQLRSFYKQCIYLISGEGMESENRIRFYGESFFRHFISTYSIDRDWKWLIDPKVARLMMYDKENETNLVECLKVLIENGFKKKEAANKLGIHYNTITYRIERIQTVSGIDFDTIGEGDELFHLLLSCKLITQLV